MQATELIKGVLLIVTTLLLAATIGRAVLAVRAWEEVARSVERARVPQPRQIVQVGSYRVSFLCNGTIISGPGLDP